MPLPAPQKCFKFAPRHFIFVPNLGTRPPSAAAYSTLLYPSGARRAVGFGAVIPPGGAPFPAVGGPSEVEGVARLFQG